MLLLPYITETESPLSHSIGGEPPDFDIVRQVIDLIGV
jgi:hypothetical protein